MPSINSSSVLNTYGAQDVLEADLLLILEDLGARMYANLIREKMLRMVIFPKDITSVCRSGNVRHQIFGAISVLIHSTSMACLFVLISLAASSNKTALRMLNSVQ